MAEQMGRIACATDDDRIRQHERKHRTHLAERNVGWAVHQRNERLVECVVGRRHGQNLRINRQG